MHARPDGLCKGHNNAEYVGDIAGRLKKGGHFPAKRHFVIANDWKSGKLVGMLQQALPGIVIGVFENNRQTDEFGYSKFQKFKVQRTISQRNSARML